MLPLLPRCRHPLRHGTLGQQHLLGALAYRSTTVHPASVSSKAPLPAASCSVASSSQQQLSHHGAPASNKPHPAEKSTPAWLVIWCTWAGFANSQSSPMLPHCLPYMVSRGAATLSPWIASAQTDANLSAHLHRLPTPPPYLRRMRLLHSQDAGVRRRRLLPFGWGCGCWVLDKADAWPCSPFLQFTAHTNPCSMHL